MEGSNWNSDYLAYMWKRHAGFDVANYYGNNEDGRSIPHNLGQSPQMLWIKDTTSAYDWMVWHEGLSSGKHMILNTQAAETNSNTPGLGTVSADYFEIGSYVAVNQNSHEYVAYLFSSVPGISKVGSYVGTGSAQTITFGFQPRWLLTKSTTNGSYEWYVNDTTRGWGSGGDQYYMLNSTTQSQSSDFGTPTSTGWTIDPSHQHLNESGVTFIYYAHA